MTAASTQPHKLQGPYLDTAISLSDHGIPLFPCNPDKSPRVRHGFKAATLDKSEITEWWTLWPDSLIGVPTGPASGILAIDVDPTGVDFIFGEYGSLLEKARRHITPRGFHYLFKYPTDSVVSCTVSKLSEGVDVRGNGGYIIWWPAHWSQQ